MPSNTKVFTWAITARWMHRIYTLETSRNGGDDGGDGDNDGDGDDDGDDGGDDVMM